MGNKEKIIDILQRNGPCVPAMLSKSVGQNTLIISSILSEMSSAGEVKITSVKFGSSPFYYLHNQKSQLEGLKKHLNEKDQRTFERIKTQKVIRDSDLEPLYKVSIRNIKDYADAIKINFKGSVEVFWKYFLLSQDEAVKLIKTRYFPEESKRTQQPIETPVKKYDDISDKNNIEKKGQTKIDRVQKPIEQMNLKSETKPIPKSLSQSINEKQTKIVDTEPNDDELYNSIKNVFKDMKIEIKELKVIRKNTEIELIVNVPSPVGYLEFFCKARSKKKINDGDISSAFMNGQNKKLPVLFVTNGKLTKKAENMYQKEFKNNFTVLNI